MKNYTEFKILKDYLKNKKQQEIYAEVANWCNENGYKIIENNNEFIVEKVSRNLEREKYLLFKNFLKETDYIVLKVSEILILKSLGLEYSEKDLSAYQEIIAQRQEKRKFVSDYEDKNIA